MQAVCICLRVIFYLSGYYTLTGKEVNGSKVRMAWMPGVSKFQHRCSNYGENQASVGEG